MLTVTALAAAAVTATVTKSSSSSDSSQEEAWFLYLGLALLLGSSSLLYLLTTPPRYHENEASYKRAINLQRIEYDDIAAYYDYSVIATYEAAKDEARLRAHATTSPPRKNELPQLLGIRQYSSYHRNRRTFLQKKSATFHHQQQQVNHDSGEGS
jgi:hypothetical protein